MNSKKSSVSDVKNALGIDQPAQKRHLKRWLIIAVLAILALVLIIFLCSKNGADKVQYTTQEAVRGDLKVIVTATGTLEPTNEVEVGSELSGIVKTVEVDFNDKVTVGQVLARIDATKLTAQMTQSKAALESAKARVMQARATVKETKSKFEQMKTVWELSGKKVPSQSDYDAAEASYERANADEASANADVSQAQATLATVQTDLAKLVIVSPIDGIVLTREIEPGQTVAASFTAPILFTLAEDLTKMELHVNVDEADIGKVHEGQDAEFTVAAYPDRKFKAEITQARYGSSTTSGVVTYETVLRVDNSDLSLRPGMTATADIMVQKVENAILIPSASLRYSPPVAAVAVKRGNGGIVSSLMPGPPRMVSDGKHVSVQVQQHVWKLENGEPAVIPVTTGMTDGSQTAIESGDVQPGMAMIVDSITPED
jgi:HlyD family secretion protein